MSAAWLPLLVVALLFGLRFGLVLGMFAVEWIEVTADKISLGGVGAKTSLEVTLWFLLAMLVYSLFSFWLHGPWRFTE